MDKDKQLHLAVSALIVLVFTPLLGLYCAALSSLIIGAAKELIWDWWLGRGCADWWDMAYDVLGIALAVAGVEMFYKLAGAGL